MAHCDCGWTYGCAGKTVRSLENTCHTWVLRRWRFTKWRYIKCTYLYLYLCYYCDCVAGGLCKPRVPERVPGGPGEIRPVAARRPLPWFFRLLVATPVNKHPVCHSRCFVPLCVCVSLLVGDWWFFTRCLELA